MTKKRKTGLVIGAVVACIAVLCAAGACNGLAKEEKAVHQVITTAETTTGSQITTTVTCATTETTTTTTEQTSTADTTVLPTTTTAPATTTAPTPVEPYNGQTSGDYIYVNGFGWVFNEGGGGEGSVNYEMYCNGNKIGYFG